MIRFRRFVRALYLAALLCPLVSGGAFARDAAFLSPGGGSGRPGEDAVKVDPKPEIDVGDTALGVSKRATVFFVNQTNVPVRIDKITISGDSSVMAEEVANDCMKLGSIGALSRCSVEVSMTPTGGGSWSVDLLMTHNGAGRMTRARLSGKTSGMGAEGRSAGLSISIKEIKPVDFGIAEVGNGKIVRSSIMINDSPDPITVQTIDVVEAGNGLQRLSQGCSVGMELASGASCPVTMVWEPKDTSPVSTDLIIRHSGKLGFVVVPIRGTVKSDVGGGGAARALPKSTIVMPPSAQELEKEVAGKIAPVANESLKGGGSVSGGEKVKKSDLSLIGTTGTKALILLPSGETAVVETGANFETGEGVAHLVAVRGHSVEIAIGAKRMILKLGASPSLVSGALDQTKQNGANKGTSVAR